MSGLSDSNQRLNLGADLMPDRERPELYGHGVCIDCLELTPRRLPDTYPHICTGCLFPPEDVPRDAMSRDQRAWSEQLRDLHKAVMRARPPFLKKFGADLHGEGVPHWGDGDR